VSTLAEAIKIAGKAEPKAIQAALWQVNIVGVNGPIRFEKDGPAGKESGQNKPSIFLVQIKDGKVTLPKL
jgi:branched-chain amino acid transport system substrate-binding protein